jgi:hypothetical protein
MRIELDTRERKIIVLRWLKQGYIETTDFEEMVQEFQIQVCHSKQDIENMNNPDYWGKNKPLK